MAPALADSGPRPVLEFLSVSSSVISQLECHVESNLSDILSFKKMITPMVIAIVFWIGVAVTIVSAIISFFGGIALMVNGQVGGGILSIFLSVVYLVVGPIIIRIYCELIMIFFRIYETLVEIRNNQNAAKPAE